MNYFEKHIGDYIRDTVMLTMLEDGAYNRLMDQMYQTERALPVDKKMVYRLARASSSAEREAVDFVLDTFFTLTDQGYEQKRIKAEIERYQEKQRKAKASADARWNKSRQDANASQTHDAPDMRTHSEGNAHQTPDTRHQTPVLKPKASDDSTDGGYATPLSSPLPNREDPPPSNDPAITLAVSLRKLGVDATFTHPAVLGWVERQVSLEVLQAAVALAREQKGPAAKIPPNYLLPIVEKLLNPPAASAPGRPAQSAPPAPPRKPQGNEPKGTDESYDEWQARVDAYERAQRGRAA